MALSANAKRNYDLGVELVEADADIIASDIVYEGSALTQAAGANDVGPLNASDVFVGFALRKVDNASGSAGGNKVRFASRGLIRGLAVTGATANTAPGAAVYATDDGTFKLTSSSALQIGKVFQGAGTDSADVHFEGASVRSV